MRRGRQRGRAGAAGTAATRRAQRGAQQREHTNPVGSGHRVAKKFPSMRFVAFRPQAPRRRGGSVSARYAPPGVRRAPPAEPRAKRSPRRHSNARTALTPKQLEPQLRLHHTLQGPNRRLRATRSSPACEMTPSDSPVNCRPSAHDNTTFALQRPLGKALEREVLEAKPARSRSTPVARPRAAREPCRGCAPLE